MAVTRQEPLSASFLSRVYREFLDSLPQKVWLIREGEGRVFLNRAARLSVSPSRGASLPRRWESEIHAGDREAFSSALAAIFSGRPSTKLAIHCLNGDSSFHWKRIALSRVPESAGEGNAILVTFAEETEVHPWEPSQGDDSSIYRRIAEVAGVGIWVLDTNDRTIFANEGFAQILGYPREEILGRRPQDFMDEAERAAATERLQRRRQGFSERLELKYRRADSTEVWVELAGIPLADSAGNYAGTAALVVDITERKRAESLAQGQTAALNRTLTLIATEPSLDTVLGHVLKAITEQLNVSSSALYLLDSDSGLAALHMTYDHGHVSRGETSPQPMHRGARHVQEYAERWKSHGGEIPPAILDVETSPDLDNSIRGWLLDQGIRTLVLVPLIVKERLAGAFSVRMRERRAPRVSDIDLAQSLAHQASLAVQLTLLAERSRRVAVLEERNRAAVDREIELARANRALKQTLDILATNPGMDDVLGHVLTILTQILEGTTSTLWLKNEDDSATLHLAYQDGRVVTGEQSGHRLAGQRLALNRTDLFAMAVFRLQRPVWHEVAHSAALDETAKIYLASKGARALLGIPMVLGDKPIGSIVVRFSQLRQFGAVEVELAQGLAQQATLALQLTRLAQEARTAAVTEERNRMAREIHDTLAQSFTGILIQLQAAAQVMNGSKPEINAHIESARALARTGLCEARRSVRGLRPELLLGGDISTALQKLVAQFSAESRMKISLEVTGEKPRLTSDAESDILRIAQEGITNAMKHSGGNQIFVKLNFDPEILKLLVEDNGDGFAPHVSTLSRGFGLVSLQERADRLGGVLTILTKPGAGTKLHLLVPLAHSVRLGAGHS